MPEVILSGGTQHEHQNGGDLVGPITLGGGSRHGHQNAGALVDERVLAGGTGVGSGWNRGRRRMTGLGLGLGLISARQGGSGRHRVRNAYRHTNAGRLGTEVAIAGGTQHAHQNAGGLQLPVDLSGGTQHGHRNAGAVIGPITLGGGTQHGHQNGGELDFLTPAEVIVKGLFDDAVLADMCATATLSNTRPCKTMSVFTGDELAANAVDSQAVTLGRTGQTIRQVASMPQYVRECNADLSKWELSDGVTVVPGASPYSSVVTLPDSVTTYIGAIWSAKTVPGAKYLFSFRARTTAPNAAVDIYAGALETWIATVEMNPDGEWHWYKLHATVPGATASIIILSFDEGQPPHDVEIQYPQFMKSFTTGAACMMPFVAGSDDQEVRLQDLMQTSLTVADGCSLILAYAPAWLSAERPVDPRMFTTMPASGGAGRVSLYAGTSMTFACPAAGTVTADLVAARRRRRVYGLDLDIAASSTARIYQDGVLKNSVVNTQAVSAHTAVRIGNEWGATGDRGAAATIMLLRANRILTATEHAALAEVLGAGEDEEWAV